MIEVVTADGSLLIYVGTFSTRSTQFFATAEKLISTTRIG
jgi:hypothetical protein